mmetsp:Transcript_50411/g.102690  ORF Transcript_50411/g.102690 Transcript_50411/m.102690 type:complete len:377 (+) Transcript_50411:135-1265(+)
MLRCLLAVALASTAAAAGWQPHHAAELVQTAKFLGSAGKGILAADESTGTIGKRFSSIGVENNEVNRQKYRELLFRTDKIEQCISGVIMFEETLYQKTGDGVPFAELLKHKNIVPGIKVDTGVVELPGTCGETATTGLDGLAKRCARYYQAGARFAKWRAVLRIDEKRGWPSKLAMQDNAWSLARYAAICQSEGLVPIVEPEILMDGPHSIEHCAKVTEEVLACVYKALSDNHVLLEGTMLKPNMVCPGSECNKPCTTAEMAYYTVQSLRRVVPTAVPAISFLSGGQTEEEATLNLNAMNSITSLSRPWALTFSYGRALQASALKAWGGKDENAAKASQAFLERANANGQAALGQYQGGAGGADAAKTNFVKNYAY